MMVGLFSAAIVGDLVLLPAPLLGPAGQWFCPHDGAIATVEPSGQQGGFNGQSRPKANHDTGPFTAHRSQPLQNEHDRGR